MCDSILTCTNLTKSYKRGNPVLNRFTYSFGAGRIVGLLGPNGCGKTTLLKLVCGLLSPDEGEITICGQPRSEKTSSLVSYLPERTYFSSWMSIFQLLEYFSDFYADFDRDLALQMIKDLDIDPAARLRTLSKGTKEKIQLVMVMARRAFVYLLDEPIAGVDPAAREYILRTIIGSYRKDSTVIITTHLIYDIEPVLDDFLFMGYGGQILLSGCADTVRAEHGKSLDMLFREVFRC